MLYKRFTFSIVIFLLVSSVVFSGVKEERVTRIEFKGVLGMAMKLSGADKPQKQVNYYESDQYRSDQYNPKGELESSTIIDLQNEQVVNIDHQNKNYTTMTFDQYRAMFETQMQEMEEETSQQPEEESDTEVEYSFDVDVKRTNERENIAGFPAEKAVITMKVKVDATEQTEEGTSTAGGDLVVTSTQWLTEDIKGYDVVHEFQQNMAKKFGIDPSQKGMESMYESLSQAHPALVDAMKKIEKEQQELKGVSVRTETSYKTENLRSSKEGEQATQEEEKQKMPKSVGGLLGAFGKKVTESVTESQKSDENILFTSITELTQCEQTPFSSDVFSPPPGYEEITGNN